MSARRLPSVRKHLVRPSFLKLLALAVAIAAGILEEVMFRRWTMNWLMAHEQGAIVQVLGSGLFFGAAHGIWGLMGKSIRVAIGATVATGLLGVLLALVFLLAAVALLPASLRISSSPCSLNPALSSPPPAAKWVCDASSDHMARTATPEAVRCPVTAADRVTTSHSAPT